MGIKVFSVLGGLFFFMSAAAETSSGTINFSASVINPVCHFQIKALSTNQKEHAYLNMTKEDEVQDEHCQMPVALEVNSDKVRVRHGAGYIVSGSKTRIFYLAYQ